MLIYVLLCLNVLLTWLNMVLKSVATRILKSVVTRIQEFLLNLKNCEISSQHDFSAWRNLPLPFSQGCFGGWNL